MKRKTYITTYLGSDDVSNRAIITIIKHGRYFICESSLYFDLKKEEYIQTGDKDKISFVEMEKLWKSEKGFDAYNFQAILDFFSYFPENGKFFSNTDNTSDFWEGKSNDDEEVIVDITSWMWLDKSNIEDGWNPPG